MKSNLLGKILRFKVASDGVSDLFLEFSQVLALRCDATLTRRRVPISHQNPGFVAGLHLKNDLVHDLYSTARGRLPSICLKRPQNNT